MKGHTDPADPIRRDVLKKAVFVAPVILTLPVIPSFARAASPKIPKLPPIKVPKG
jgi:hypothetical protein